MLLQDRARAPAASGGMDTTITHGEAVIIMENYGTIWVCVCCMLAHANGECCALDSHPDGREPLESIEAPFTVAMGMSYDEHAEDCLKRTQGADAPGDYECDCETNTYSTSQCEGCGSYLHGERHAMTLFKG